LAYRNEVIYVDPGGSGESADGREERPFLTPGDAVAAIEGLPDWRGVLVLKKGNYQVEEQLVIPPGVELRVLAGAKLELGPGVSVHAQANVKVLGTAEEPVTFTWLEPGSPWGGVANFEASSQDNVFEWAVFEHGYETNFKGIGVRGALSLSRAKARISHCTFRNNEGDDGLNLKESSTLVEHSTFEDNQSDALDADGESTPEIRYSFFRNNGNDAVDLGEGAAPFVHDNVIIGSGDKGISNGEGSTARIEHNTIVDCGVGIGIKDDADPRISYNTLYGNLFGLRIFQEDAKLGGGKGRFVGGIIWASAHEDVLLELGTTEFAYSCIQNIMNEDGSPVVEGEGLQSSGNGCDDPLFVDPANMDFHLKSEGGHWNDANAEWQLDDATSPCIDAGDPGADPGEEPQPNGSRVNLGVHAATAEASRSP
jgi:hypothetical protein